MKSFNIYQEVIKILNLYASNNMALNYIKQNMMGLQFGNRQKCNCVCICQSCFIYIFSQSILEYFNTLLLITDRISRKNYQNNIKASNNCRTRLLFEHMCNTHKIDHVGTRNNMLQQTEITEYAFCTQRM